MQVACHISLESSWWELQLCFKLHFNQKFEKKIGPSKSREFQFRKIWDSNLGVLGQNDIWVLALWPGRYNIIRGRLVASPNPGRGEFCESVFDCGSSVHQKCSNYALTNLLFDLCRSMWIIDSFVIRSSPHPRTLACPFTPRNATSQGACLNSLSFHYFHLGIRSWVYLVVWGRVPICVSCISKVWTF
jgi:hypothetical protein